MNNIKWKDGAVCFAGTEQLFVFDVNTMKSEYGALFSFNTAIDYEGFQLNEPRIGDYIEKSELDTEQKYNDIIEVFGLFGFKPNSCFASYIEMYDEFVILIESDGVLYQESKTFPPNKRKLTYNQLMAIGKLKRLMNEREDEESTIQKAIDTSRSEVSADNVKNPNHYQLMDGVESIEIIARSMTQEQWKGFCLGNMLKYRIRAGKKDVLQQDIDKANFYGELYEMHKEKCYD